MQQLEEHKVFSGCDNLERIKRIFRVRQHGEDKGLSGCNNFERIKDFPDSTT
jgi:hypothetical protein